MLRKQPAKTSLIVCFVSKMLLSTLETFNLVKIREEMELDNRSAFDLVTGM